MNANETFNDNLRNKLQSLSRDELLAKENQRIEPGWTEVANFSFAVPVRAGELSADDYAKVTREFVKLMHSVIAMSLPEVFSAMLTTVEFVLLSKLTQTEDSLAFRAILPFHEIIRAVLGYLPPKMESSELLIHREQFKFEIRHQYALPIDTLVPIVVIYKPVDKQILLTNSNHFSNPSQFLSPYACRTTSGFLNFIGTNALHVAKHVGKEFLLRFENLEDLADQGLDDWCRWLFCCLETGELFSTSRLYVNSCNPEEYRYVYIPGGQP